MAHDRFPMFISLENQKVLVAGGGPIGKRRMEVLLSFGARVTLVDPGSISVPEGVCHLARCYQKSDLEGVCLAVAATSSRETNRQIGLDARALGIPVSVSDSREECTFFFPAVCRGGGLTAGVVSQGQAHSKTAAAAKKIRSVLEEFK